MKNTKAIVAQENRNKQLIQTATSLHDQVESHVLPFTLDLKKDVSLTQDQIATIGALEKVSASTALKSLASLAEIGELDHLGGGLELIPSLHLTLACTDYTHTHFTVEHAHTSVGYYSALASLGFLSPDTVIKTFRRSLDIAGHIAWVPGGTQLNGGRLGVMIPVAVGQALGLRAHYPEDGLVLCHCGDAGWISGQALNGFNGAHLHQAPIVFVMNRNGIQLSGPTKNIINKDPRPMIEAMGIELLEIVSLHDTPSLWEAYRKGADLAKEGKPSMIYPTGLTQTLDVFAQTWGIEHAMADYAKMHGVDTAKPVWVPGSLMSWRDVISMIQCIFAVNDLPGGETHHDGHMKGRDLEDVLSNPMLALTPEEEKALEDLKGQPARKVVTDARPTPGTPNLVLQDQAVVSVTLPEVGQKDSPRTGTRAAYEILARTYPKQFFNVGCDLSPSTKLDKAEAHLDQHHHFEMGIEEQVALLMANGLAMSSPNPQLNIMSTFAAFFEGIAREGLELWRYQRNLNGVNEGLNVMVHMSHVGACTGRDHFSGWSLDWITLAMGYLPYIDRFYAPADARAAFIAVRDAASRYGAHILGIPRDKVPTLSMQGSDQPLWKPEDPWTPLTPLRQYPGSTRAILAFGCTAFLAAEAAEEQQVDAYVINGLPFGEGELDRLIERYTGGMVTIEDGIIATPEIGLRGFASLVQSSVASRVPLSHIGITNPTVAPSDGFKEVWEHFGITKEALIEGLNALST